ncbi:PTS sugar transporter subunit IIA [Streptococcus panodentis]|uniref:PTS fructose transporter subunit IIA n=1 Tax=Streptococcus panodentis TaxID=1581472 RepID=A0ABS5AVE5_9STRE|nr:MULTISPECIES: PTS fructose transporter subunit IIA [Streptococcus]KXT83311.1 PTS system, fructose- and mannose-inducible IIA component [Streptococcus sp. DD11]MBP2620533.1 PTS fructose transporter subunit IIA [Streptococcus panodentis]
MKYLVLVSHGGLAEGVQSSLKMFAGDKTDQIIAVGLKEGKSVDDFAQDFRQAIAGLSDEDTVLVLADIVGGSPLTTAASVLAEIGKLESAVVLGGLNLTMGLTGLVMKDILEGKELAQAILAEASAALQEFEIPSEDEEEEDDDI